MGFEFPYGNGLKLISGFLRKQLENKKKLDILLKSLFQVWDKDGYIVDEDDQLSFLPGFDDVPQIDGAGDDYSYIMNCSSDKDKIYVAGLIEKLLSGINPDRQFVEEIKKVWKKVICAGGVFSEEK